jgi:hypothetical protein
MSVMTEARELRRAYCRSWSSFSSAVNMSLCQKGLAVTGVVSATLIIEAFIMDIQPLVTATTNGPLCIVLFGDVQI